MRAYKTTIDCEKLSSDAMDDLISRLLNTISYAARSNFYLQEMGKPLYIYEIDILNLQEMDEYSLNNFIDNLPNLYQQSESEIFTGISYNLKFDVYKFRKANTLKEITNKIHTKGGKVETFTSERLTREEAGLLVDVDFYVEYS